nr:MAG: hypothetical protein [Narnaviridae sp.]
MSTRWAPPLPTIGRAGPRIAVLPSSTLLQRMEEYYCETRSSPDIFERRVSPSHSERSLRRRLAPTFLSDMSPGEQQSVLLRNLYFKVSAAARSHMKRELQKGNLHHVRSWFHTANAAVLPLLISSEVESQSLITEIDVLTAWAIENCAHNYAHFQRMWKTLKKRMRKSFATHRDFDHFECEPTMLAYKHAFQRQLARCTFENLTDLGRFVLLWTQTRATGMADDMMVRQSVEKFHRTVSEPGEPVKLNPAILRKVTIPAIGANGRDAKVSVGTTSCLESTRAQGGKTNYLKTLASSRSVRATYNLRTLEETSCSPRPVRSAKDLVDWAVYHLLHNPTYTMCVRVHGVAEPSKARTITVAPYAYQVVMGVLAHVFQPTLRGKHVRSGLKADRHLWRFLQQTLNPQNVAWGDLLEYSISCLSTDLSEATDWGHKGVARQIWHALISAAECPEFPLGLAILAKSRYIGKRFAFLPDGAGNYSLTICHRGWLMGDMMTKVILTLAHQYCCELTGLTTYTLVGDDEIALSNSRSQLTKHYKVSLPSIFKVSEDDTYVSDFLMFYCEEGAILPQSASESTHVRMRRGEELPYLDYPRLRLLLPQIIETDAYSMTNIGRFSLLGKESRWVHSTNPKAGPTFARAALLQHMLVPMDSDNLCPFTPIEIGGDGGFPHSAEFLSRVIEDKSIDPRETKYRLTALMNNKFGHKFVRSDRLDKVVNKHHLYLPKLEGMRDLLPESAIVDPPDINARLMLQSVKYDELADPQSIFFEIAKGLYYKALLEGKDPPEPVFNIDRHYTGGHTNDPQVDFHLFIETWKNPGFKFQDTYGYWILRSEIPRLNPMNLGWEFDKLRYPSANDILKMWVAENVNFEETSLPDILNMIRNHDPLPKRVVDRLNLFIESDNYIMYTLPEGAHEKLSHVIVTRDQRLCLRLKRHLDGRRPQIDHQVFCLDPAIYMIGRMEEVEKLFPSMADAPVIEDPGAMLHVDYNEFTDGFPEREDIWDAPIDAYRNRHGIVVARV